MKYDVKITKDGYKVGKIKLPKKDVVNLMFLGDVHYGADTADIDLFCRALRYAKDNGAYIVLMGDLIENANKNSVGAGWVKQTIEPQRQKDEMVKMLMPYKDLIIGCVRGNHEERTYKDCGFDVTSDIMALLGISERYYGWEMYAAISLDQKSTHCYTLYAIHSYMGSKNGGLALNATKRDIMPAIHADIIARAHTHQNTCNYEEIREIDKYNGTLLIKESCNLLTGHFLDRAESYAAQKPYQGAPKGTRLLTLQMNEHKNRGITDMRFK